MEDAPRKGSLLVIFLTIFIDLLGFGMVLPLLPIYADHYSLESSGWMLGALMASYSLMQMIFSPLWGRLSDRIGRRPVLMIGLASSVVFYFLFGFAATLTDKSVSLWLLFASRIGAGIAGATISTAQAYIADTTSLENRAKGMALIGMGFGLGFTFGPLLGFAAVPTGHGDPGPWPGYIAAGLSAIALVMAIFWLPESRQKDSESTAHRLFDLAAWRSSFATPSVGMLLIAIFVCIFSFAKFETTLSLLIKGDGRIVDSPFGLTWGQLCLTYAFIGFTLALVQGGIVRRVAGRVHEGMLAAFGAACEIVGFAVVLVAINQSSGVMLFVALFIVVTGFAFMQPNLNALLSRRTDPEKQGMILGVNQSVSSLARILGPFLGIPMLKMGTVLPYLVAASLMGLGLILVSAAAKFGKDYAPAEPAATSAE